MTNYVGDANSALSALQGYTSGTPQGDVRGAANTAKIAGDISGNSALSTGGADALSGLNIYSGIKQGGIGGDTEAALGAAQLGSQAASAAGVTGGAAAAATVAQYAPIVGFLLSGYLDTQTPAFTMHPSYYQNLSKAMAAGPGPGNAPGNIQQTANYWNAVGQASDPNDKGGQALLQDYGIAPIQNNPNATADLQSIPVGARGNATRPRGHMAKGGSMKKTHKKRHPNPRIQAILERGAYRNQEPRHYDDGGYVNYAPPSYLSNSGSGSSGFLLPNDTYSTFNNEDIFPAQEGSSYVDPNNLVSGGVDQNYDSSAMSGGSGGGGGGGSGASSALSSLGSLIKQYGALAPILGAALGLGQNKPASAPATPAGYGAIPSIPTPNNTRSYTQPNIPNWYTYGQGPEQSFFSNNQLPYVPGVSPASAAPGAQSGAAGNAQTGTNGNNILQQIAGGSSAQMNTQPVSGSASPALVTDWTGLNRAVRQAQAQGGTTSRSFDSSRGDSYVSDPGYGDGTSDDIDAKLSGGEYVMDGGTVSMLGNGSNEAGARALDQLRQRVRQHAGKSLVKGKQFMKAKAPEAYLRKPSGGKS